MGSRRFPSQTWWLAALLLGLAPRPAGAVKLGGSLQQRGFFLNVPEAVARAQLRYPDLADARRSERYVYQLRGTATVEARPVDALGLAFGLDTGLLEIGADGATLDGRDVTEQLSRTLLLGPTWIEGQLGETGALLLRAGKYRARIAEGAVFDAYAFGLLADLDLGLVPEAPSVQARLQVLFPSGALEAATFESPLFHGRVGYRFGRRTDVGLLGAVYLDRGAVGPVLSDALVRGQAEAIEQAFAPFEDVLARNPCPPDEAFTNFPERVACFRERLVRATNEGQVGFATQTEGHLGWVGASGRIGGEAWSVDGLVLYGFGTLDLTFRPNGALAQAVLEGLEDAPPRFQERAQDFEANLTRTRRTPLSSWLAQVTARYTLLEDLSVDGFVLAVSGDDGLPVDGAGDTTYRAFLSLAPLLAHTSLYFGGGAAAVVASPTASAIAPDAAGLVAGGLGISGYLGDRLHARAVVAAMQALVANQQDEGFQGVEVNLLVDVLITRWLFLFVEGALLVPGPYYGDVDNGYLGIVGAQITL